jgi:hypothetical protein
MDVRKIKMLITPKVRLFPFILRNWNLTNGIGYTFRM